MQEPSTQRLILVLQSHAEYAPFIEALLAEKPLSPQVVAIADTQTALDYLQRRDSYNDAPRPDLILLDLDLPGALSGYELLETIKGDSRLRRIPIVVLSLSANTTEIFKTYASQGNCYVIRPGDRDQLAQIIRRIEDFWLNIVTLPQE